MDRGRISSAVDTATVVVARNKEHLPAMLVVVWVIEDADCPP